MADSTTTTTTSVEHDLQTAAQWINESDCIVIASGAGISFDSGLDDILPEGTTLSLALFSCAADLIAIY